MLGAALASTVLNGAIDQMFSSISQSRNWQYTKQSMDYQQRLNEKNMALQASYARDMFDYQNEYNKPSNAVARWRSAGIAPQAVYGSSPGGAGVGGSLSSPTSENPSASGVSDSSGYAPVMTLADIQRMKNETKVAEAQVNMLNAQADKLRGDTRDPEETKRGQSLENRLTEARVIGQELANRITSNDADFSDYALGNRKQLSDAEVTRAVQTNNKIIADIALSVSQKDLNEQSARESVARILQTEAQTALLENQNKWYGKLTQAQIDSIYQGIDESLNRMSLNDSQKFLNAAKEWNTMADTKAKDLANWRQELANALDAWSYSVDENGRPNFGGNMTRLIERLANLFHFGVKL